MSPAPPPVSSAREARRVVLALLGVQLTFASWFIIGKVTIEVVPPLSLVFLRVVGGMIVFVSFARAAGRPLFPPREIRGEVFFLAATGIAINQGFFTSGLHRTSAVETAVLGATIPVITVLYAVLSKREKARRATWIGIAIALTGALLVARRQRLTPSDSHVLGNALVLVSDVAYAIYLVRARSVLTRYGAVHVVTWLFVFATLVMLPFGLAPTLTHAAAWSGRVWGTIAFVVLFPTAYAYAANAWALQRASSSLVAVFIYLQPVLAISFAIACGDPLARWLRVRPPHERLTLPVMVGMALVLVGVYVAARPRRT